MIRAIFITNLNRGYANTLIRFKGYKPDDYILYCPKLTSENDIRYKLMGRYNQILNNDIQIIYIEESEEFNKPEKFIEYNMEARQRFLDSHYWG